jgi:PAS domain S-box-containing protein
MKSDWGLLSMFIILQIMNRNYEYIFMKNLQYSKLLQNVFCKKNKYDLGYSQVKHIFDLIEAFVAAVDLKGDIRLLNKKGMELLGCREGEAIGKNFISDYIVDQQQAEVQEIFRKSIEEDPNYTVSKEYLLRTRKKQTRTIKLKNVAITDADNNILGVLISGGDITGEERSSLNYKRSRDKAERSRNEAEQLNQQKSEFFSNVIHDIRTPLSAIMGFTEQLMQTDLDRKQEQYLKIIEKSSEHMLSLVNDILVLSKIEAYEFEFDDTPFQLPYPVRYVYKTLQAKAEEKKLGFKISIDGKLDGMVLIGDAFRLRQILINMLNNAIKFTSRGGVELACILQAETDEGVVVRFDISDTGIGIDPEKISQIFEQFKQADSTITKNYGGSGLGLTICKQLIDKLKGSLSVSSQQGVGTTFTFTLPFRKGNESDIMPDEAVDIDAKKLRSKKVLLVDDDSVNRLLGKVMLDKFNCDYDIANSGEEAIEKLKSLTYDILLLDVHMPDISGLDVARFIRKGKQNKSSKIIAITAAAMKHDIKKFYDAGIDDFIIKPFKEQYLFNKMCRALQIQTKESKPQKAEIILKGAEIQKSYSLAELKKMAGGDQEFITQMLVTFIRNTENTIHLLPLLLKEKKWEQIGETAHKILPSFRHLEVKEIISKLVRIKTNTLIKPDQKNVPELVNSMVEDMKNLVLELKGEIKE